MRQLIVDYLPFEVGPDQINEAYEREQRKNLLLKVFYKEQTPKIKMVEYIQKKF